MQNHWDERYANKEYIYGTEPNEFLKETLRMLTPAKILFPAEGEGRNSVYAASLGWDTYAFDQSTEGQKKALALANLKKVSIHYSIELLESWHCAENTYDCIALIFVHLPENLRKQVHAQAIKALKPGGTLILEAFTPAQLELGTGGPKTTELLFSKTLLQEDFVHMEILQLYETQTHLNEGPLHHGMAEVVRLVTRKPE